MAALSYEWRRRELDTDLNEITRALDMSVGALARSAGVLAPVIRYGADGSVRLDVTKAGTEKLVDSFTADEGAPDS